MSTALTFTLILTAELLLLFRLAIPYAWERFIAFGQTRFDTHFGAYGDVPAVPDGLRRAACSTPGEGADKAARRVEVSTGHIAHDKRASR